MELFAALARFDKRRPRQGPTVRFGLATLLAEAFHALYSPCAGLA